VVPPGLEATAALEMVKDVFGDVSQGSVAEMVIDDSDASTAHYFPQSSQN
jgi:hypothetical protein